MPTATNTKAGHILVYASQPTRLLARKKENNTREEKLALKAINRRYPINVLPLVMVLYSTICPCVNIDYTMARRSLCLKARLIWR